MKIYVNRLPIKGPWGGGNMFVQACYDHLESFGQMIVHANDQITAPDVILLVGTEQERSGISAEQAIFYKNLMKDHRDVKIILRVNENDARKGTSGVDAGLINLSSHIDGTIFVSRWLREYFMKKEWNCHQTDVIKNGVDKEVFKPGTKIGGDKIHLVTHHWSNNEMKGFDIYEKLDEWVGNNPKFDFTYIGRDRGTFKNSKVIEPLFGNRLGEELGKYDVYISASRFDPGPNHVIEAISAELPTYVYKDCGGGVEFAGEDHVYNNWEHLISILQNGTFHTNSIPTYDWKSCIGEYVRFISGLL